MTTVVDTASVLDAVRHHLNGPVFRPVLTEAVSEQDVDDVVRTVQELQERQRETGHDGNYLEDIVNCLMSVFPKPDGLSAARHQETCGLVGRSILIDTGFRVY